MSATIRKLIVNLFEVIVNSDGCHHDERRDARIPKNILQAPFKLYCHPENRAQTAPGPSPRCSTTQYTFLGNLRPVCPFQAKSEKL